MAKEDEIGAMWSKQGPKGEYLTGKINGLAIVAYRNVSKKNPNEPDWRILKSKPKDGRGQSNTRPQARQQAAGIEESDPFA